MPADGRRHGFCGVEMARIRTIKPEFWTSEQVIELSRDARLLFVGMWNFCDDAGVHPAAYKTLKAEVFPGDDITGDEVKKMVREIIAQGLLGEFEHEGRRWWFVTGWKHQLINRPSTSRYPSPPRIAPLQLAAGQVDNPGKGLDAEAEGAENNGDSPPYHDPLTEDSLSTHGGLITGKEGKGRERKGEDQTPANAPIQEVQARPKRKAADAAVRFDAAGFLVQNGVEPQTAADYLTLRKSKNAPATHTAMAGVIREISKAAISTQAGVEMCCCRGWAGFKAEWIADQQARAGPRLTRDEERKRTLDELTGRTKHGKPQQQNERDITAEVIRIA